MTVLASCLMICLLLASPCVKAESESSSMMMSEEMTEMIEDTSEERKLILLLYEYNLYFNELIFHK